MTMTPANPIVQDIANQNIAGWELGGCLILAVVAVATFLTFLMLFGRMLKEAWRRRWPMVAFNIAMAAFLAFSVTSALPLIPAACQHQANQKAESIVAILHGDFDVSSIENEDRTFKVQSYTTILGHRVPLEGDNNNFYLDANQAAQLEKLLADSTVPQDQASAQRLAAK